MDDGKSTSRPAPSSLVDRGPGIPPPARTAGAAPIIVTAMMGAADQKYFDALRRAHFPAERNYLSAHITLFHQLAPSALDELDRLLRRIAADTPVPKANVGKPFLLGRGVAFRVESPELLTVRERIADHFSGMLTAQDQGVPRLHITVQNKVSPKEAKTLHAELAQGFEPRALMISGLAAHHYLGGPWELAFSRKFCSHTR